MPTLYLAAQPYTSSPLGLFSIPERAGCAPFTIQVSAPSCGECDIRYSADESFEQFQLSNGAHTYNTAGTYTILLVNKNGDNETLTVQVFENHPPAFQVSRCTGNQVSVKILENVYDDYIINFNGEASVTVDGNQSAPYTFTSGTSKTVSVKGRYNGAQDNCVSVSDNVIIGTPIVKPVINQLTVVNSSSINLDLTGQDDVLYGLEISKSGAAYQALLTTQNQSSIAVNNIYPDENNNFYCFRLRVQNACAPSGPSVLSDEICSAYLRATPANDVNNLSWITKTSGVAQLMLNISHEGTNEGRIVTGKSSYPHEDIICGTEYCYTLETTYSNGSKSTSLTKCAVAVSTTTPSPIENTSAQVNSNGVYLEWTPVAGFTPAEYSVFKSDNGSFKLLAPTASPTIDDAGYLTESESCYQISYVDICGNQSPRSNSICPIILSGTLLDNNNITLNWTEYKGWSNGVLQYDLEKYDSEGTFIESIYSGSDLTFTDESENLDEQVYIYVVKATQKATPGVTLPVSISNPETIIKNPNLFYPTAFTPNGDALNDIFNVYGQYVDKFELSIFNRWGELMFTTTDLHQGWDGKFKGKEMPEGTYTFIAKITDRAGRTFKKSGSIVLLEKTE